MSEMADRVKWLSTTAFSHWLADAFPEGCLACSHPLDVLDLLTARTQPYSHSQKVVTPLS
jgi:hypothetical protein